MNKQQLEQETQRVQRVFREARELLGLTGTIFRVEYDPGYFGDEAASTGEGEGDVLVHLTAAVTISKWQYEEARIKFYMAICAVQSDARLFAICVHELVHVLLNPIDFLLGEDEMANKLNELATERVTRALLSAAGRPRGDESED